MLIGGFLYFWTESGYLFPSLFAKKWNKHICQRHETCLIWWTNASLNLTLPVSFFTVKYFSTYWHLHYLNENSSILHNGLGLTDSASLFFHPPSPPLFHFTVTACVMSASGGTNEMEPVCSLRWCLDLALTSVMGQIGKFCRATREGNCFPGMARVTWESCRKKMGMRMEAGEGGYE